MLYKLVIICLSLSIAAWAANELTMSKTEEDHLKILKLENLLKQKNQEILQATSKIIALQQQIIRMQTASSNQEVIQSNKSIEDYIDEIRINHKWGEDINYIPDPNDETAIGKFTKQQKKEMLPK